MRKPLYIRSVAVFAHADEASAQAELESHRDTLPRAVGRRMSAMGLAIDRVMAGETPAEEDLLVFASEFGMTRMLEDYVASFPCPSPLAFQNSIHPAGMEQYLVPAHRKVREFLPLAGESTLLLPAAFRALALAEAGVARLIVAEEAGTTLTAAGCGASRTFAFRLTLSADPAPAIGTLRPCETGERHDLETFVQAVADRRSLQLGTPDTGYWSLDWV